MEKNDSLLGKSLPLTNENSKTWVLLMKTDIFCMDGNKTPDIVKLRHPRTGLGTLYLFSSDNSTVQEIMAFSEKRSWFINDSVRENGELHFSTPIDPCFLILPYLKKAKDEGKVVPLDDLLIDSTYPEIYRLLGTSVVNSMQLLADKKGSDDLNAWMYNEEKTLCWLSRKTKKMVEALKQKEINVRNNAPSKLLNKVFKNSSEDDTLYLKYAHGLVSEYLTDDLSQKLYSKLGLPEEESQKRTPNKRKLIETNDTSYEKKMKIEKKIIVPLNPTKSNLIALKGKTNAKANLGTKSIKSFFTKT